MKKSLTTLAVSALFLSACGSTAGQPATENLIEAGSTKIHDDYVGSDIEGNFIWGGAMNLAWNELSDNILGEDLALATDDKAALEITQKFNNRPFNEEDLSEDSYYVKSGYGQETVELINKESREKFPEKSFKDLEMKLAPQDIISYAYFVKEVEYPEIFEVDEMQFADKKVKSFKAESDSQKNNVRVLEYENDNKFIIELKLKNQDDQLILAKGFDMQNPSKVIEKINMDREYTPSIRDIDSFEAPKITLDYSRIYEEMLGKFLANKGFKKHYIAGMYENIKFHIDEKGAKVENEGIIGVVLESEPEFEVYEPRNFILDEPFWIIMKQDQSEAPYFMLGLNNANLMEKS
jgi:hypothetical protein